MKAIRMTPEQVERHQRRVKESVRAEPHDGRETASTRTPDNRNRRKSTGQLRKRKGPNKTEAAFGNHLGMQFGNMQVLGFEAITLRMPGGTRYTPDWPVTYHDGKICFYEVKGFMREAARVRLKEFAAHFTCFRFFLVRARDRRLLNWDIQEVG